MIRAILMAALMISPSPALAQWETTSFLPVPDIDQDPDVHIQNGFDSFATPPAMAANGYITYDTIDFARLKSGAFAALTGILSNLSFDAKKMALASFRKPLISPVLSSKSGDRHYPIFWNKIPSQTWAQQICNYAGFSIIRANSTLLSYQKLNDKWSTSLEERALMFDLVSSKLTHELVHAVQGNGGTNWGCKRPGNRKWLTEGTADGIAHYLLSKRVKDALRKYQWARNERSYASQLYSDNAHFAYNSGSFFRYLIEATEKGGKSDLSIMRDVIEKMTTADVSSRSAALTALERILQPHSSNRPLSIIFAEFVTEYASYADRYGKKDASWMIRGFGNCAKFQISPGAVDTQTLDLDKNAARCLKVEWASFESPVALQIYVDGAGVDEGSLHLGEAIRDHNLLTQTWRCYDVVTQHIDDRLARPAEEKCMMRRGAVKIGSGGAGPVSVNGWTSDFNLFGDGYAYLILANAAEDIASTKPVSVELTMGSDLAKDETAALSPRKKVSNPVQDGRTLMDSRVHAIAGGKDRLLLDGRSVDPASMDTGFLQQVAGGGQAGQRVVTIVRAAEYWVLLFSEDPAASQRPDGAVIMKSPDGAAASLAGSTMSLGLPGMPPIPKCGYEIPAKLTYIERKKERLVFEVSGDLFEFSPQLMMRAAQSDFCTFLKTAHRGKKTIEVSLPWAGLYDGAASVERAFPPLQNLYDTDEFRAGPSFGGIGTSQSLLTVSSAAPAGGGPGNGAQGNTPAGTSAVGSPQCVCHCPGIIAPPDAVCFAQCEPDLKACPNPASPAAAAADVAQFGRLLGLRQLPREINDMLLNDFKSMTPETRTKTLRELLAN